MVFIWILLYTRVYTPNGDEAMPKRITGTREWAQKTVNFQIGCEHNCRYCYAAEKANRFGYRKREEWHLPKPNFDKVNKKKYKKFEGWVMVPSTHDITPYNVREAVVVIGRLLEAGNKVLIVTKPHKEVIHELCHALVNYKERVMFRFTISSDDDKALGFWEPGAPSFRERHDSLIYAFKHGFQTSVSMEPMIDDRVQQVLVQIIDYITDTIWIGKMNLVERRVLWDKNNTNDQRWVDGVKKSQTDEAILKLYDHIEMGNTPTKFFKGKIRWKDSIKEVLAKHGRV
jgi:hypothetical protein